MFKKNWRESIASIFLAISFFFYLWVATSCKGLGCLFGLEITALFLFLAFIFIILSIVKNKITTKNTILGSILLIFFIILFVGQIHIGSKLSGGWQALRQSNRCQNDKGHWNIKDNYCDILQSKKGNCEIRQSRVTLWNSGGSEVIVPYEKCNNDNIRFSLKNGDKLFLHNNSKNNKIMEFSKIAPETIEEAISFTAFESEKLPEGCFLKKVKTPNRWVIAAKEGNQVDCGPYSQPYDDTVHRYFMVLDKYLLLFVDEPENSPIDFKKVKVQLIED